MTLKKNHKILLGVAAAAIAAYFLYRWWQNRQAGQVNSPTGALGTNLNSVAPELVGGSSGPSVGPAVSLPVNITLTSQAAPDPDRKGVSMNPGQFGANPAFRPRNAAASVQPGITGGSDEMDAAGGGSSDDADEDSGFHADDDTREGTTHMVPAPIEAG